MKCSEIIRNAQRQRRKILTLSESMAIVQRHEIPFAKNFFVKYPDEAAAAAKKIGFPVALKVISPNISHKTDVGGLKLNLRDEIEVTSGFKEIVANIRQKQPNASISGFLVQKMVEGLEVLIGGKKDMQFGQTIAFGAGGVFVEVYDDISFRVVPISKKDAEEMVREVKAYKILHGYRGKNYDVTAIQKILLNVSKLLEKHQEISELDINPIFVQSKGAVAVDVRIAIQ